MQRKDEWAIDHLVDSPAESRAPLGALRNGGTKLSRANHIHSPLQQHYVSRTPDWVRYCLVLSALFLVIIAEGVEALAAETNPINRTHSLAQGTPVFTAGKSDARPYNRELVIGSRLYKVNITFTTLCRSTATVESPWALREDRPEALPYSAQSLRADRYAPSESFLKRKEAMAAAKQGEVAGAAPQQTTKGRITVGAGNPRAKKPRIAAENAALRNRGKQVQSMLANAEPSGQTQATAVIPAQQTADSTTAETAATGHAATASGATPMGLLHARLGDAISPKTAVELRYQLPEGASAAAAADSKDIAQLQETAALSADACFEHDLLQQYQDQDMLWDAQVTATHPAPYTTPDRADAHLSLTVRTVQDCTATQDRSMLAIKSKGLLSYATATVHRCPSTNMTAKQTPAHRSTACHLDNNNNTDRHADRTKGELRINCNVLPHAPVTCDADVQALPRGKIKGTWITSKVYQPWTADARKWKTAARCLQELHRGHGRCTSSILRCIQGLAVHRQHRN